VKVTPQSENTIEFKIKKSRFIGFLSQISEFGGVQIQLNRLRDLHPQVNHICWAYRITGDEGIIKFSFDAGEPSGTAGIHLLNTLKKFDLINSMIGAVRYFGGTKLGRSGLAKAYSETAQRVVEGAKLIRWVKTDRLSLEGPYEFIGEVVALLNKFKVKDRKDLSSGKLKFDVLIPAEKKTNFCESVTSVTSGNIIIKEME
jgi:uncharacterized YigZ family protein